MEQKYWWKNLQPLRIPAHWSFEWNKLELVEPDTLSKNDAVWDFTLVQDILFMHRKIGEQTVSIDLGWYPDGNPDGAYRLVAILGDDWENPILEATSRSTKEIVDIMEYWLFECIPCGRTFDEKSFRKRHPNKR